MPGLADRVGETYGRLIVMADAVTVGRRRMVRVRCQCGKEFVIRMDALRSGNSRTCGCGRKGHRVRLRHGHAVGNGTAEYRIWSHAKARCLNVNDDAYADYGGRGIVFCDRWSNSYEAFLSDMGMRPSTKHTIERVDNSKGYEPGNCVWADMYQQTRNKRNNRWLSHGGETLCLEDWSRRLGISDKTLATRLTRGWSVERALETPVFA